MTLLTLIAFALLCQPPSPAATAPGADSHTKTESIRLCPIKLTDAGRSSTFRFECLYLVATGKDGAVDSVKEIRSNADALFVDLSGVIGCIRNWRLRPNSRYVVTMSLGTTGENFLLLHNLGDKRTLRVDFA